MSLTEKEKQELEARIFEYLKKNLKINIDPTRLGEDGWSGFEVTLSLDGKTISKDKIALNGLKR